MIPKDIIESRLQESFKLKEKVLSDSKLLSAIEEAARLLCDSIQNNGTVFLAGNGGSAADAQHIAGELIGRFYYDRPGFSANTLGCNLPTLTAIANDYDFERIYSRELMARAKSGDIFIAISTSGNSPNILLAAQNAAKIGVKTIAMTGAGPNKLSASADITLAVPSGNTPRIQEIHILIGHILCEIIESTIHPQTG